MFWKRYRRILCNLLFFSESEKFWKKYLQNNFRNVNRGLDELKFNSKQYKMYLFFPNDILQPPCCVYPCIAIKSAVYEIFKKYIPYITPHLYSILSWKPSWTDREIECFIPFSGTPAMNIKTEHSTLLCYASCIFISNQTDLHRHYFQERNMNVKIICSLSLKVSNEIYVVWENVCTARKEIKDLSIFLNRVHLFFSQEVISENSSINVTLMREKIARSNEYNQPNV